jgi:hypothetical protein
MQPGAEWEDAFNEWYNREHVPARLALPGFTGARRYAAVEGSPKYAVVYYLAGLDALRTPGYRQLKQSPGERTARMLASVTGFTRYVGEEIRRFVRPDADADPAAAALLYAVLFAVPADREDAFNGWYDEDHCPLLLQNAHWRQIRRYRIRDAAPKPWTHLALHYLSDLAAMTSAERDRARRTPRRARLAAEPWFAPEYAVYQRLQPTW